MLLLVCLAAIVGREVNGLFREAAVGGWKARLALWASFGPVAVTAVILAFLTPVLFLEWRMSSDEVLPFFSRALDITSALTPALPFLMGMTVLALWALCSLRRAFLLEVQGTPKPSPQAVVASFKGTLELYGRVIDCLKDPWTHGLAVVVPIVVLAPFYRIVFQPYTTIDGKEWSAFLKVLLVAGYFAIVYNYVLFILLWIRLKRLLRRLALHPLLEVLQRLPDSCTASPWKLWSAVPNVTTLAESVALLKALVNLGLGDPGVRAKLTLKLKEAEILLGETFEKANVSVADWADRQRKLREVLAEAGTVVTTRLESHWQGWPGPKSSLPALKEPDDLLGLGAWIRRGAPSGDEIWTRLAEEFVALRASSFVRSIFQHLKNLLASSFLGFVFALGAISSYPFQPKYSVMTFVWVLVLVSVILDMLIFVDMERDPVLSYMGKTKPGRVSLNADFLKTVGLYVILPLVALAAAQFPGVGDAIFSVLSPAMRSLGR